MVALVALIIRTFAKVIKSFNRKHYDNKKKTPEELRENKLLNRACREVEGFSEQLARLERNTQCPPALCAYVNTAY